MKKTIALCMLAVLLLAGCGYHPVQPTNIDANAAKQLALEAAGLSEVGVEFAAMVLESRNGLEYYPVDFTVDGEAYHYDIDALTGTVIDSTTPAEEQEPAPTQSKPAEEKPAEAPKTKPAVQEPAEAAQNKPAVQKPAEPANNQSSGITEEEAKSIALSHAGVAAADVSFVKSGLDWDDGQKYYDVEFYTTDGKEYDYEIDPATGKILDFDYDAEYYTPTKPESKPESKPQAPAETVKTLTADEAKAIAIAQVPGASLSDIREFETDHDDGRLEYEGKIYFDHMEYEFEIDGYSGAIRSWDVESIFD